MSASPPSAPPPLWWSFALLLPLALAVYLPAALGAQFLGFDDNYYFGPDNPEFQRGFWAMLDPSQPIANVWLPVSHVSLWFDWWWGDGRPFTPHLHSLLLHGLTAVAFARLLLALRLRPLVAHLAAAWFLLHPALAESVAWVSGRKDVLSGLFVCLALQRVVAYQERGRPRDLTWLALCAALAMYAKATAVVLPLLVALALAVLGGDRRRWRALWLCLLVVLPIAWHHQLVAAAEGTMVGGSLAERLPQVPGAFWHYVATAFWPARLNVLYPEVDTLAHFRAMWLPGAVALAVWLLGTLLAWRPARALAAGLLAFALALAPFNTAFPASSIAAADRYLYLAVPGLALALATAVGAMGRAALPLGLAVAAALAYAAGSRAQDFRDDQTLWTASLAVEPSNAVARLNRAGDRMRRGPVQLDQVRPDVEAAAAAARYPVHELRAQQLLVQFALLDADYPLAAAAAKAAIAAAQAQLARETAPKRRTEATALLVAAHIAAFEPSRLAGDDAGAQASWAAAHELAPTAPDVVAFGSLLNLAACVAELQATAAAGKTPRLAGDDPRGKVADAALAAGLAAHPRHAGLLLAQAEWDRARDRVTDALRRYNQAIAAAPERIDAYLGAARLMRERELFEAAAQFATRGLALRPDPSLRQELALALVGQNKLDEAELHLRAYLKLRPADHDAGRILANLLTVRAFAKLAEPVPDRAAIVRLVDDALAFHPKEARAQWVLGRLARLERRNALAIEHFEAAFAALPQLPEVRQGLVESLAARGYECLLQRDDDAAVDAWLRCVELAPADFDVAEIRRQLQLAWSRYESRGVAAKRNGDRASAVAAFRRCLRIDPAQHWAAWLLATTLQDDPGADLGELAALCRQAIAWQRTHELDRSQPVLLLCRTLRKVGDAAAARAAALEYLQAPDADAKPQVLDELRQLAGG